MRRIAVVALVFACVVVSVATGPATAEPAASAIAGHWQGFTRSVETAHARGPFTLDVGSQGGRRITATMCGTLVGGCIDVRGTIAERGQFTMVGTSNGGRVRFAVVKALLDESDLTGHPPKIFRGRYELTLEDGSKDNGSITAVHQVADADAPWFGGNWGGSATVAGGGKSPSDASFVQDRSGALIGSLDLRLSGTDVLRFDIAGQAFGDTANGGAVIVGLGTNHNLNLVVQTRGPTAGLGGTFQTTGTGVADAGTISLSPRNDEPVCEDDSYEPNDDPAHATAISVDVPQLAMICAGDEDFFLLNGMARSVTKISVAFSNSAGDLDLVLYNSTLISVAHSDGTGNQELIQGELTGGPYYLRVLGYNGASNSYALFVTYEGGPPPN